MLSHPTVSRSHAKIRYNEGTWIIEDMGSANGIFVDDNRVENAVLEPGKTHHTTRFARPVGLLPTANRSHSDVVPLVCILLIGNRRRLRSFSSH
jgi:pSer/pThr/pTyr-binding forkhead associated (FHA) protein